MPSSKTAKETYYALDAVRRLEFDIYNQVDMTGAIPAEWGEIAASKSVEKEKVTVRIDADVLKFLRSMGPGYQLKMNRILRGFMHAKLAGLLQGPDSLQAYLDEKETAGRSRAGWGEFGEMMEAHKKGRA